MKKKLLIGGLLVVLIAIAATFFWNETENKNTLTLYGNVDIRQVDLGFRVYGRVVQMPFEEGDTIEPGVLMACLERKPYSDQVLEAEATLKYNKATLENNQNILKRRCELISSHSVSQEDLDDALTAFETAAAQVQLSEAALAIARKNLKDTQVFAPTKGTILTRIREPGSIVNQGDSVYTLSITSPVWIRAFVHEPELGLIYPGMPAEIYTDTPGGKVYKGNIGFISPVSEFTPKTVESTVLRTDLVYRIRIYAENPDESLKQGMPITVKLRLKNHGNHNGR